MLEVVLARDMRHVNGNQDIGRLLLETDQVEDNGGEVGGLAGGAGIGVQGRSLRGDEGVGGDSFSIQC